MVVGDRPDVGGEADVVNWLLVWHQKLLTLGVGNQDDWVVVGGSVDEGQQTMVQHKESVSEVVVIGRLSNLSSAK